MKSRLYLESNWQTTPILTRLYTQIREKQFTLNFSKASPTQTDKGQAKPSYLKKTENCNTELRRSGKEKMRALKLILNQNYAFLYAAKSRCELLK